MGAWTEAEPEMGSLAPEADEEAGRIQVRDERVGGIRGSVGAAGEDPKVHLGERSWQIVGEGEGQEEIPQEREEKEIRSIHRKAYGSQLERQFGEMGEVQLGPYDSKEHWNLSMCSDKWAIEVTGPRIWLDTLYICQREGKSSQIEIGKGP